MKREVGHFWRQVAAVLTGSTIAQLIPILGSLILARLFAPQEFGLYAAWQGVALFFAVAITGRFETALAMVADGDARRVAVAATLLTSVFGAILLVIAVAGAFFLSPAWLEKTPAFFGIMVVPAAFAIAGSQIWQSWAAAEGEYKKLSIMRIVFAFSITVMQIVAGLEWASSSALVVAHVMGASIGFLVALKVMPLGRLPQDINRRLLEFWSRYRRLPIMSLPADVINTAAAQLPLIIVASRFGSEISGYLALSLRTLGAPISLLGRAVLDVFRRHAASDWRARGECRDTYSKTFMVLSTASVLVMSGLMWWGEELFSFCFGENWRPAGTIAVWLLPMFMLRFVASPLSYMFYLAEKQHIDLMWQISLFAMTVGTLTTFNSYSLSLQSYGAGYSMLYVIYLILSYRLSQGEKNDRNYRL